MASIFQRAMKVARSNLTPVVERGLREMGRQAQGRASRSGGARGGIGAGTAFPGRAGSGRRPSTIDAGPATVRTVEVGGVPVTSRTRAFDGARERLPVLEYTPRDDGRPDPGEVVWTWIPFDDLPSQGKDRPALVLGRVGHGLLAAQLTSRDRARDGVTTDEYGRVWMDVGTGAWDGEGRPSEVRLDKLWVVEAADVRREGAALPRRAFDDVTARVRILHA